jgi:hypothetical protein
MTATPPHPKLAPNRLGADRAAVDLGCEPGGAAGGSATVTDGWAEAERPGRCRPRVAAWAEPECSLVGGVVIAADQMRCAIRVGLSLAALGFDALD